jgi:hypothetical protein
MNRQTALSIVAHRGDTICNRRGCSADAQFHGFVTHLGATNAGHYEGGYCSEHFVREEHSHPSGDMVIHRAELERYLSGACQRTYAEWSTTVNAANVRRTHRIDLAMVILMVAAAAILGTALGLVIYARI